MASATITRVEKDPVLITMTGTNIDAGNNDIDLSYSMINMTTGFTLQTGTLTAMDVKVYDSADGVTFIDSTEDYFGAGVTVAASDKCYKCDLDAPVYMIKIRAVRSAGINAVALTVFAPNR